MELFRVFQFKTEVKDFANSNWLRMQIWVLTTLLSPKDTIHASASLELIIQFQDQVYEDYFEV